MSFKTLALHSIPDGVTAAPTYGGLGKVRAASALHVLLCSTLIPTLDRTWGPLPRPPRAAWARPSWCLVHHRAPMRTVDLLQ